MNRRHKIVAALSVAFAGLALLNGAKVSEGLGIILLGASLAWVIGAHFVLRGSLFVWKHRIWVGCIAVLISGAVYGWIRYAAYETDKSGSTTIAGLPAGAIVGSPVQADTRADSAAQQAGAIPPPPDGSGIAPVNLSTSGQPAPQHQKRSPRHVRALYETDLTTTEYGSLKCGHIRAGETALLVIDDNSFVKVKTVDGRIGWAASGDFEVFGK